MVKMRSNNCFFIPTAAHSFNPLASTLEWKDTELEDLIIMELQWRLRLAMEVEIIMEGRQVSI